VHSQGRQAKAGDAKGSAAHSGAKSFVTLMTRVTVLLLIAELK
jgi:hypothetical protein